MNEEPSWAPWLSFLRVTDFSSVCCWEKQDKHISDFSCQRNTIRKFVLFSSKGADRREKSSVSRPQFDPQYEGSPTTTSGTTTPSRHRWIIFWQNLCLCFMQQSVQTLLNLWPFYNCIFFPALPKDWGAAAPPTSVLGGHKTQCFPATGRGHYSMSVS